MCFGNESRFCLDPVSIRWGKRGHQLRSSGVSETAKTGPIDLSLAFFIRIWEGSLGLGGALRGF